MGAVKDLIQQIHDEIDKLESGAADRLRALFDKLTGHVPEIKAEVKADAEKVVHDTEAAAAPVVAEAEHDAQTVAQDAVHAAEQAVTPAPAAAPETPTA